MVTKCQPPDCTFTFKIRTIYVISPNFLQVIKGYVDSEEETYDYSFYHVRVDEEFKVNFICKFTFQKLLHSKLRVV